MASVYPGDTLLALLKLSDTKIIAGSETFATIIPTSSGFSFKLLEEMPIHVTEITIGIASITLRFTTGTLRLVAPTVEVLGVGAIGCAAFYKNDSSVLFAGHLCK